MNNLAAKTRLRSGRIIIALFVVLSAPAIARGAGILPEGNQPEPIELNHFPSRLHAVVWRNWQLVKPQRIAQAVGATTEQIRELAASMGLPDVTGVQPEWRRRGYITIVRRNWHLLPYDQLLVLLDMTETELAEALREDDFLFVKLGSAKPRTPPVRYGAPSEEMQQRAAQIKEVVERYFESLGPPAEQAFAFVQQLSSPLPVSASRSVETAARDPRSEPPRYIYSYFGVFGDPLIDAELDPFPDGLLARLAQRGVNGVWLHVLLRQLAPGGETFPEFGEDTARRLDNLRKLVERARRHGIAVYLYMNEPRAMPASFFENRPKLAGVQEGGYRALCTSDPRVLQWLSDALAHVFTEVPGLGGVFTITASENLTHCASHFGHAACPRCRSRRDDEIIAEVNHAISEGVHRGDPQARVIMWDWGWKHHGDASSLIRLLPKRDWFMSVSEWSQPLDRGGIRTTVGEYSISVVGPGPRAQQHWKVAREHGMRTVAKVQLNCTWELSAVPYLPVMDLVAAHCENLARQNVDGFMLSWSLGGYPSPNLRVAQLFAESPQAMAAQVLDHVARELYGDDGAAAARRAWTELSRGFREYPYHGGLLYDGPQQVGPANLLFARPTGYRATMVGFPYDDLRAWRGPYPADVFVAQMQMVADGWRRGGELLEEAVRRAPADRQVEAQRELGLVRAAQNHFASTANQARFVSIRDAFLQAPPDSEVRSQLHGQMREVLQDEIRIAQAHYHLARADSRIGFEASNHYYYVPLDLVEKVVSCTYLLDRPLD